MLLRVLISLCLLLGASFAQGPGSLCSPNVLRELAVPADATNTGTHTPTHTAPLTALAGYTCQSTLFYTLRLTGSASVSVDLEDALVPTHNRLVVFAANAKGSIFAPEPGLDITPANDTDGSDSLTAQLGAGDYYIAVAVSLEFLTPPPDAVPFTLKVRVSYVCAAEFYRSQSIRRPHAAHPRRSANAVVSSTLSCVRCRLARLPSCPSRRPSLFLLTALPRFPSQPALTNSSSTLSSLCPTSAQISTMLQVPTTVWRGVNLGRRSVSLSVHRIFVLTSYQAHWYTPTATFSLINCSIRPALRSPLARTLSLRMGYVVARVGALTSELGRRENDPDRNLTRALRLHAHSGSTADASDARPI